MINVVVVGGIRTHYIKINAVQKALKQLPEITDRVNVIYVDAAQHYDVALTGFKQELGLSFNYVLEHETKESFERAVSIFAQIGRLFDKIQKEQKIDFVVVMGDVATTMVVAMAAVMKQIKVAHIEAGVRVARGNGQEEYYRTVADHVSSLCFASTQNDYDNLLREAFGHRAIFSGDIIYDYIKNYRPIVNKNLFHYGVGDKLFSFDCEQNDYVLVSLHHIENLNFDCLQNTFTAIHETGHRSIFIAHPRVKRLVKELGIETYHTVIADFIPYLDNLIAIANCRYALTDSGGIQRETFYFGKRCIVRSDLTVWKPIVEKGVNITCAGDLWSLRRAIATVEENLDMKYDGTDIFGNGNAVKTVFENIVRASEMQ